MKSPLVLFPYYTTVFLLSAFSSSIHAQQAPNPLYATTPFSEVNFRQNFCDEYDRVHNETISLPKALKGVALRPVLAQSEFFSLDSEGRIPSDYPGLTAVLLDELCSPQRADCTWRDSFSVTDPPPTGKTWTDLLEWTTHTYDVSVDWWASSVERMALGVAFPESWYDASIIMVGKKDRSESTAFDPWAWLTPFDRGVWILILVSIVASGLVYWCLELIDPNSDKRRLENDPIDTTFLVAIAFTSHFEFHPRTHAARLFTFSVAFWALLVGAAYTANLASFLVVRNQPTLEFTSVAEAVRLNLPLCTYASTQADVAVSQAFPQANIVRKELIEQVYEGVSSGECAVAITTVSSWNYFERVSTTNGNCDLEWIGRTFQFVPAGFATVADSGTYCTSLLRDVINYHFLRMKTEGFLEEAWNEHLTKTTDWNCNAQGTNTNEADGDSGQLTLQNMGGVFIFHAMLTGGALLLALVTKYRDHQKKAKAQKRAAAVEKICDNDLALKEVAIEGMPAGNKDEACDEANAVHRRSISLPKRSASTFMEDFDDEASRLSISDQWSDTEDVKEHIFELRRQSHLQKKQMRELREEMNDKLTRLMALCDKNDVESGG